MTKENFKTLNITSLYLKNKDLTNLSLEEVVELYEDTHDKVLKILSDKEPPRRLKSMPISDLGL